MLQLHKFFYFFLFTKTYIKSNKPFLCVYILKSVYYLLKFVFKNPPKQFSIGSGPPTMIKIKYFIKYVDIFICEDSEVNM